MEAVALTFGIIGFVFGVVAVSEVNKLKKQLQELRNRIQSE